MDGPQKSNWLKALSGADKFIRPSGFFDPRGHCPDDVVCFEGRRGGRGPPCPPRRHATSGSANSKSSASAVLLTDLGAYRRGRLIPQVSGCRRPPAAVVVVAPVPPKPPGLRSDCFDTAISGAYLLIRQPITGHPPMPPGASGLDVTAEPERGYSHENNPRSDNRSARRPV